MKRVQCVPVPITGAVLAGTGAVRTLPTRTIPVWNPTHTNYGVKSVDIHHIEVMGPDDTTVSYWP